MMVWVQARSRMVRGCTGTARLGSALLPVLSGAEEFAGTLDPTVLSSHPEAYNDKFSTCAANKTSAKVASLHTHFGAVNVRCSREADLSDPNASISWAVPTRPLQLSLHASDYDPRPTPKCCLHVNSLCVY